MKRKINRHIVSAAVLLIAAIAANLILLAQKDNIVIYRGIAFYRVLRSGAIGFLAAGIILMIISLLRTAASAKKIEKEAAVLKESESPVLSVKGKLSNETLRRMIRKQAAGKWQDLHEELNETALQLEAMDAYQLKLHTLLSDNDVIALSDTEDILEQTEQAMCQNVRKLLNYMNVFDLSDREVMRTTLKKTNEKNARQLHQVKEFILAVTDFVNQQGSAGQDPEALKSYITMILDTLKEEVQ